MERNLKNVLVISFGFFFLFTAYGGLQSLQVSWASPIGYQDGWSERASGQLVV